MSFSYACAVSAAVSYRWNRTQCLLSLQFQTQRWISGRRAGGPLATGLRNAEHPPAASRLTGRPHLIATYTAGSSPAGRAHQSESSAKSGRTYFEVLDRLDGKLLLNLLGVPGRLCVKGLRHAANGCFEVACILLGRLYCVPKGY